MIYRIRYRRPGRSGDAEMVIEAGSPNEAMVKFQCASDGGSRCPAGELVTSVRAEENCYEQRP